MQRNSLAPACIVLCGAICAVFFGFTTHTDAAMLRALNKVTARTQDFDIFINEPVVLANLKIVMRACVEAPPEEPPETVTFLEIDEQRNTETVRIFTGWMFASSPGLHAIEHPVYDLWPLSCRNDSSQ